MFYIEVFFILRVLFQRFQCEDTLVVEELESLAVSPRSPAMFVISRRRWAELAGE